MLSSTQSAPNQYETTPFFVSKGLNNKTRFKEFHVEVVELSTTAPYSPLIDSLRGYSDTLCINKKLLKRSLYQCSTYQRLPSFVLELKTLGRNELAGLLTFELKFPDKLYINGLGILEKFQRNGLGTILMSHAIEIAHFKGVKRLQLESDQPSLAFYKNKIGMTKITEKNLMQIDISQMSQKMVDKSPQHLKRIPHVIHVLGKSKYLP